MFLLFLFPLSDRDILEEDKAGVDLLNSFVGRHPFSSVAGDHDQSRRARMHGRTPEEMEAIEQQRKYENHCYHYLYDNNEGHTA